MKGIVPRPPCVCMTIEDTGCGIKQRHLGSIFDPFFTTKAKGSGLGLYNARLAIEKQQGAISVKSQEGVGTTFQNLAAGGRHVRPAGRKRRPARGGGHHSLLLLGPGRGNAGQGGRVASARTISMSSWPGHGKICAICSNPRITSLPARCSSPNRTIRVAVALGGSAQLNKSLKVALRLAGLQSGRPGHPVPEPG